VLSFKAWQGVNKRHDRNPNCLEGKQDLPADSCGRAIIAGMMRF
jgi:hypothetical protein